MHMLRGGHSSTLATSTTVITQFVSAAEIIMGYLFGHRPVYKYQLIGYSASRGYYRPVYKYAGTGYKESTKQVAVVSGYYLHYIPYPGTVSLL